MKTSISMLVRADTTRNMSRSNTMTTTFRIRIRIPSFLSLGCSSTILTPNTTMRMTAKMRYLLKRIRRPYSRSSHCQLYRMMMLLMKMIHAFKTKNFLKSMLICLELVALYIKKTVSNTMRMKTFNMSTKRSTIACC